MFLYMFNIFYTHTQRNDIIIPVECIFTFLGKATIKHGVIHMTLIG